MQSQNHEKLVIVISIFRNPRIRLFSFLFLTEGVGADALANQEHEAREKI